MYIYDTNHKLLILPIFHIVTVHKERIRAYLSGGMSINAILIRGLIRVKYNFLTAIFFYRNLL